MTNNKYDAGHSPVICGIQSSGQYSFGATLSISCFFVSLTMRNVASVHDEIVRQRHDTRHCERGVERHRLIYVQRSENSCHVARVGNVNSPASQTLL